MRQNLFLASLFWIGFVEFLYFNFLGFDVYYLIRYSRDWLRVIALFDTSDHHGDGVPFDGNPAV